MGGRAVAKGKEPAKEAELLLDKACDISECLSPGQHRQQTEQQHFPQRIHNLPLLAGVCQILEIPEK